MMSASKKKCANLKFQGDKEVFRHIVDIDSANTGLKSVLTLTTSKSSRRPKKKVSYAGENTDTENSAYDAETFRPSEVLADDCIVGKDIYGFKTPKKSGQMAQKAATCATPLTDKAVKPAKGKKPVLAKATPKGKRSTNKKPEATTPYRLRKRNEPHDSSNESSDSDDTSSVTSSGSSAPSVPVTNGVQRRSTKQPVTTTRMAEDYFAAHKEGTDLTSDRTLARLKTPRMDQAMLSEALKEVSHQYEKECKQLMKEHTALFKNWMFQLCNGFNLVLYGVGSKRQLIDNFRQTMLKDFLHVVINGYFPSITIKSILNAIIEDALDLKCNSLNHVDEVEFLRQHFKNNDECAIFILIHNIDGLMLRNEKVQNILSLLAQIPGVHFIASVDHINAPLVWDQSKMSRFNWVWYDATTYASYTEETSYENSLLVQQSGALALSSLTHVMRSLTPNAKGIFRLLVNYQLENKDNQSYLGMSFQEMYQKCRESFLVNSDLTLRAQLTEFRDHKLIRSKKGLDGVEHLYIPLDAATLEEFLNQQDEG